MEFVKDISLMGKMSIMENRACIVIEPAHAIHEMIANGVCKRYKFESVMLERMSIMENNRACIIIEPAHAIHEKKKVEVSVETTILFCQDQVLYWLQKRVLSNYKEP